MKIKSSFISRIFRCISTAVLITLLGTGCNNNPATAPTGTDDSTKKATADPLPSWNDGAAKQAIVQFVHATTDSGAAGFVVTGRTHCNI